jgi:hypothetical protein
MERAESKRATLPYQQAYATECCTALDPKVVARRRELLQLMTRRQVMVLVYRFIDQTAQRDPLPLYEFERSRAAATIETLVRKVTRAPLRFIAGRPDKPPHFKDTLDPKSVQRLSSKHQRKRQAYMRRMVNVERFGVEWQNEVARRLQAFGDELRTMPLPESLQRGCNLQLVPIKSVIDFCRTRCLEMVQSQDVLDHMSESSYWTWYHDDVGGEPLLHLTQTPEQEKVFVDILVSPSGQVGVYATLDSELEVSSSRRGLVSVPWASDTLPSFHRVSVGEGEQAQVRLRPPRTPLSYEIPSVVQRACLKFLSGGALMATLGCANRHWHDYVMHNLLFLVQDLHIMPNQDCHGQLAFAIRPPQPLPLPKESKSSDAGKPDRTKKKYADDKSESSSSCSSSTGSNSSHGQACDADDSSESSSGGSDSATESESDSDESTRDNRDHAPRHLSPVADIWNPKWKHAPRARILDVMYSIRNKAVTSSACTIRCLRDQSVEGAVSNKTLLVKLQRFVRFASFEQCTHAFLLGQSQAAAAVSSHDPEQKRPRATALRRLGLTVNAFSPGSKLLRSFCASLSSLFPQLESLLWYTHSTPSIDFAANVALGSTANYIAILLREDASYREVAATASYLVKHKKKWMEKEAALAKSRGDTKDDKAPRVRRCRVRVFRPPRPPSQQQDHGRGGCECKKNISPRLLPGLFDEAKEEQDSAEEESEESESDSDGEERDLNGWRNHEDLMYSARLSYRYLDSVKLVQTYLDKALEEKRVKSKSARTRESKGDHKQQTDSGTSTESTSSAPTIESAGIVNQPASLDNNMFRRLLYGDGSVDVNAETIRRNVIRDLDVD